MKKFIYSLFITGLLAVLVVTPVLAGYTISPRLLAGQTQFAGVIKVTGDANFLTFEFQIRAGAGWCMEDFAIHIGDSLDDFPQNAGGAIPGQFDYQVDPAGCVTGFTYQIPTNGWYGQWIYIAVHANVYGPDGVQETAWTVNCGNLEGGQFPGTNWSAYFRFPANAWY
jgi:hypothetical protein